MKAPRFARAIGIAAMALSLPVAAFDPGFHRRYTSQAGEMLRKCDTHGVKVPSNEEIDALAKATEAEDDASIVRLANWHYAHNPAMARYFLPGIQMDLRRIFDRRVDELFEYAGSGQWCREEVFRRAGSVAHYIQDMRVPAHVIPINHGSVFGEEAFDKYPFAILPVAPKDPSQCEAWKAAAAPSRDTLARLLADARVDTRRRMHTRIPAAGAGKCTWSKAFWCDPAKDQCPADIPGFGTHRKSKFGDLHVDCEDAQGRLRLTPADYDDYFREAYQSMLVDTAIVVLMANELAGGCKPANP